MVITNGFLVMNNPFPWGKYFPDSGSEVHEGQVDLHDSISFYLILILVGVAWMMVFTCYKGFLPAYTYLTPLASAFHSVSAAANRPERGVKEKGNLVRGGNVVNWDHRSIALKCLNHASVLEVVWTLLPAVILLLIALPSFRLLYLMDELVEPSLTLKAIGKQWLWGYEYGDFVEKVSALGGESSKESLGPLSFESYMLPLDSLEAGGLRLLEVDNRVVLPVNSLIRVISTSADVIHSWSVPSLGIKVDALPGRLNQASLFINGEGLYYGMCSELCGIHHFGMPIAIEAVEEEKFLAFVLEESNN